MAEIEASPRRQRSPGYPALDLKTAIERTIEIYRVSPRHPVPLEVAAEEWGFSPKSSSNKTVAAALKRFGFVRDVGNGENRQLALTDDGREIAFSDSDRGSRWNQLVRDAALRPKIHRQVLDQFEGTLPDDRVALRFLLFDLGFGDERVARDFLAKLKSTIAFAGIGSSTEISESDGSGSSHDAQPSDADDSLDRRSLSEDDAATNALRAATERQVHSSQTMLSGAGQMSPSRKSVQIPYSHDQWATLEATFPLAESEWDALIAMLQAMRPGLVQ